MMYDVKLKVGIDPETADEITRVNLKDTFNEIYNDFISERHQRMFDIDVEKDKVEVKKFLQSLRRVHDWYSAPSEQIKNVKI